MKMSLVMMYTVLLSVVAAGAERDLQMQISHLRRIDSELSTLYAEFDAALA